MIDVKSDEKEHDSEIREVSEKIQSFEKWKRMIPTLKKVYRHEHPFFKKLLNRSRIGLNPCKDNNCKCQRVWKTLKKAKEYVKNNKHEFPRLQTKHQQLMRNKNNKMQNQPTDNSSSSGTRVSSEHFDNDSLVTVASECTRYTCSAKSQPGSAETKTPPASTDWLQNAKASLAQKFCHGIGDMTKLKAEICEQQSQAVPEEKELREKITAFGTKNTQSG